MSLSAHFLYIFGILLFSVITIRYQCQPGYFGFSRAFMGGLTALIAGVLIFFYAHVIEDSYDPKIKIIQVHG